MNKRAIANAFSRAACQYNLHAEFQRQCGQRLLAMLQIKQPGRVLDAGCGTGIFSGYWRQQGNEVTALDLSAAMLTQARISQTASHYILGDMEDLPLATGQFDLCWSNLALQWCGNLQQALSELYRVTAADGTLAFTTLAEGSLAEMHQAWQAVDQHLHVNLYPNVQQIISASPCQHIRWQQQTLTLNFPDILTAMRSVKNVGATYLYSGRRQATLTRGQLQRLALAWPQRNGRFTLSWQVVFGVIDHD